jgi:RNA polymerase sigma-70 factor (ECF subfamily)
MVDSLGDDARWLSAAREGSGEALGRLLEACRNYLRLVAERELDPSLRGKGGVSDLVQETLFEAVRDFERFHGSTEAELLAWLRRLLLNNLVSFTRLYRQTGKRQVEREVPLSDPSAHSLTPSGHAMVNEQSEAIRTALGRLPEEYRRVLRLRYEEGQPFEQIGAAMGLSSNAARKLWVRAVKRLQHEAGGDTSSHDRPRPNGA